MLELLQAWMLDHCVSEGLTFYFARGATMVVVSVAANFVTKRYILPVLGYTISRSKSKWDDAILRQRMLSHQGQ